ncbi:hypothetical protein Vafri_13974, partial [Volvox africanus]
ACTAAVTTNWRPSSAPRIPTRAANRSTCSSGAYAWCLCLVPMSALFPFSTHLRRGHVNTTALQIRSQRAAPALISSLSQPRDSPPRCPDAPGATGASPSHVVPAAPAAVEPGPTPAAPPDACRCSESAPPMNLSESPDPPSLSSSPCFAERQGTDALLPAKPDSGAATASVSAAASSAASATAS